MPSPPRRGEIQLGVEAMKSAVSDSLQQEKKWIQEHYGTPICEDDYDQPPIIYIRYHNLVYKGLTYFQVQKQSEDDLFLNQIDKKQSIINYTNYSRQIIDKQLVFELLRYGRASWKMLAKLSDAANDHRFYDSAIHAAASFVCKFYTMEELIRLGRPRMHMIELNKLWERFAMAGVKGCTIDELCKSIVQSKIDKESYSLVTETDLYGMLQRYDELLSNPQIFQHPYEDCILTEENEIIPTQAKIKQVISEMNLPTRSKVEVDEYTRFLIIFVRQYTLNHKLRDEHMEMIDKEGLHALNPELLSYRDEPSWDDILFHFEMVLNNLTFCRRCMIMDQISTAVAALHMVVGLSLVVANEVLEIVEVAELRRIALGSRFINRNHLIWAFYECGFGLPPEIRKYMDLPIAEEDHPPYLIYLASKELASTFGFKVGYAGETKLHLEHFVFSILYAKDIIVDKNQVTEMEEQFKTFIEVVAWDGISRPNRRYEPLLKRYWSQSEDED